MIDMLDTYNRNINYLRISVTDRCNLRCRYCMPEEGISKLDHREILSLEDIVRSVKVAAGVGIRKIRLTGGEPLVRKDIARLIGFISEVPEIDDIAMTTNGVLFADMAEQLKAAGLDRVNFSMDTMVSEKFRYISRRDHLADVRKAIFKALELGLEPVKINTVVIRGFNDDELLDFADLAFDFPLHIRFIEFMPIGDLLFWKKDRMITSEQIKEKIEQRYELTPTKLVKGSGPARYFKLAGGRGTIGFITPMSHKFCSECNRLRMTADGKLRGCLYDKREIDLKKALQSKPSDEDLKQLFIEAILLKPYEHHMDAGWGKDNPRKMSQIGG
ncbi:molybdenum cofactor biosynthesis protein A [Syntrophus aciditrophicus SB]|uniref:GTP 3',8-cyclase n=2 Tax=Syntrophus TaxID=43773 RepID=Q2LQ21_SYNAS|nr:molybdenum cofactor biosynthesis protein A [Syntrophus aciditrophicus SB]